MHYLGLALAEGMAALIVAISYAAGVAGDRKRGVR